MSLSIEHAAAIAREMGLDEHGLEITPLRGGDIAQAHVLRAADLWVFVKTLPIQQGALLSAEADGLKALTRTGTVRVPGVIRRGVEDETAWLALEYLELDPRTPEADERLGRELAALHRNSADHFGWHRNNYIGLTPQHNPKTADWTSFFLEHRLGFQFDRLTKAEHGGDWPQLKEQVFEAWHRDHADHHPLPALVHGDLWQGNASAIGGRRPVVFDPAVHYADRETDLAMTRLFNGFSDAFYEAYESAWPLHPGHESRANFYTLYHVLNHANLFGGGYPASARRLCQRIVSGAS
ncbi:fructosamine kinase family protein [Wenzhouxiangella sp. AB-CW3]|uniref:fructosamine kinase family protein n=1 Tax=Wenzhouxiangella sp. AB-CW3 TaxID=2771012 RepID=UPI00168B4DAE|nr:fructosamine kinase family protein [Wenzhouxiangella sp. AB-CW3]QOC22596.1 fructosamine kinase family protein [Wenzhouxiangella sp. AB-CW3]